MKSKTKGFPGGIRRLLSLLTAVVMVFALAAPAFAAGDGVSVMIVDPLLANKPATFSAGSTETGSTFNFYKLLTWTSSSSSATGDADENGNVNQETDGNTANKYSYVVNSYYSTAINAAAAQMTPAITPDGADGNLTSAQIQSMLVKDEGPDSTASKEAALKFGQLVYTAIEKDTSITPDKTAKQSAGVVQVTDLEAGYYLIVEVDSASSTSGKNEAKSVNMLYTIPGGTYEITTKDTVPTLEKEITKVVDPSGAEITVNGDAGVLGVDYTITFTLTGTVTDELDSYSTYEYTFVDTIDSTLAYQDDAKAAIGTTELTIDTTADDFKTENDDDTTTYRFSLGDLKTNSSVKAGDTIVLTYSAKIYKVPENATIDSYTNTAYVEFSNDPYNTDSKSQTPTDTNTAYSLKLDVYSMSDTVSDWWSGTDSSDYLDGAAYTLYRLDGEGDDATWTASASWSPSQGWSDASNSGISGKDSATANVLTLHGLGQGTYALVNTTVPQGYDQHADYYFQVDATATENSDADASISTLTASVATGATNYYGTSDGPAASANTEFEFTQASTGTDSANGTNTANGSANDYGFGTSLASGTVSLYVPFPSGSILPTTGGAGLIALYAGGIALIAAAALLVVKKRKGTANSNTAE